MHQLLQRPAAASESIANSIHTFPNMLSPTGHSMKSLSFFLIFSCLVVVSQRATIAQDYRTWKDATGSYQVKAEYVRLDDGKVVLRKEDGTELAVPLDKLSPIDQGYVEGRKSSAPAADPNNPFQVMGADKKSTPAQTSPQPAAAAPATTTSSTGVPTTLSVDCNVGPETAIAVSNWQPAMDEQPLLAYDLKPIPLKGKSDFWEKLAHTAVNSTCGRMVLTHHFSKPGRDSKKITRMELVDLKTGQTLANASGDGLWKALAIADDGERIVVQDVSQRDVSGETLGTVTLRGKKIVPIDLWKPYEKMDKAVKEKIVRFARFINGGKLLTLSQNGRVVIWDFESRTPVRRFNYHGACQPSLSNDRKYLAICGGDIFGIVNLEDASATPSVMKAPQMNYWLSSSFSPTCKRFAAATMGKLMVWDVASGDVLFEGKIPGVPTNGQVHFPHEDFVMINNDKVIEIDSKIKLWRYHGASPVNIGGQTAFVHIGKGSGKMLPISIPHPEALALLQEAKSDSDLFILKKGAKVSLDLNQVPQRYRGDVEQKLKENLERKGFVYAGSAPLVLTAKITGPTQEAINYTFAGSFVFNQYDSFLNLNYEGKSLWGSRASNVPGMVSGRDKAGIKKQLQQAGSKPNLGFFGGAQLPDYLQKPSAGSSNNRDAQMLGSTAIGLNGLGD